MIIGLTGLVGAGKGEVVRVLENKGFESYTMSDELRVLLGDKDCTREELREVGDRLRKEKGAGAISKLIKKRILEEKCENAVVDGIRNPAEIEVLRGENFYLLALDSPQKVRYERVRKRAKSGDVLSFDDFLRLDEKERGHNQPENGTHIEKCEREADFFWNTDYPSVQEMKKEFTDGVFGFVNLINPKERRRPSVGEVFMRQAYEWSQRSTCLRRKVGAAISMENIPISAGYNGAVRNAHHCKELGCKRQELSIPSGQRSEICRGAHAEQNAIINAGRNGRSVVGATLYSTTFPCSHCTKDIVQSGIQLVLYHGNYDDKLAASILDEGGVEVKSFSGVLPRSYPKFWG